MDVVRPSTRKAVSTSRREPLPPRSSWAASASISAGRAQATPSMSMIGSAKARQTR